MGEARRKREAREAAFAEGRRFAVPDSCPACPSKRVARIPASEIAAITCAELACELATCLDCKALWEPFAAGALSPKVFTELLVDQ